MQKILVYLSGHQGIINFGMLKELQGIIPIKIYAIIDQGQQPKEFYQKQKFVKFEKIWHYTDYVKPFHKPDIKYLKKIEDEFRINLWNISYSDSVFFVFDGKSDFKEDEILSLVENDCKLFENIIKEVNPNFLVIHTAGQKQVNILRKMCMSKQIKILQYGSAKFGLRTQISQNYDILDKFPDMPLIALDEKVTDEFLEEMKKELNLTKHYKKISSNVKNEKIEFIKMIFSNTSSIRKESSKQYTNFKNQNIIIRYFKLFKKNIDRKQRKKFLEKNSIKIIPKNERFIIFPLHLQPEITTSVMTPFFTDQISVIRNIARSLPVNYFLYVKEHPSMGIFAYWRDPSYYKKILDIPNVKLIHPDVNSLDLFEKSQIVLTINGSANNEALLLKKQTIVFADVASIETDATTTIKNLEDLPIIIRGILKKEFSYSGFKRFCIQKLNETIPDRNFSVFGKNIKEKLFVKGVGLFNITEEGMEYIFREHDKDLRIYAEEYLRKISQWKKLENSKN